MEPGNGIGGEEEQRGRGTPGLGWRAAPGDGRGPMTHTPVYNFRVAVPQAGVYDPRARVNAVNLFDMSGTDADVMTTAECVEALSAIPV